MNPQSRAELNRAMTALANGDRVVVAGVFRSLWPVLQLWCRRWLPAADADDAAQLAILKVFAQAALFDRDGDALSWALSIATWECKTIRKQHTRRCGHEIGAVLAHSETPESLLLDVERGRVAQTVLDSVDDGERALLEQLFADEKGAPKSAAMRKKKQRMLERVRAVWRKIHGST